MGTLFKICRFVAAGFGSGWLPKAPGTWGSLASLPVAWFLWQAWGVWGLAIACAVVVIVACLVCAVVLAGTNVKDPSWIVIDEWAGQWLSLLVYGLYYELSFIAFCLAFFLFRVFDIWKPFPIQQVEHLGPVWWSITADDLLAGLMAAGIAVSLYWGYLNLW